MKNKIKRILIISCIVCSLIFFISWDISIKLNELNNKINKCKELGFEDMNKDMNKNNPKIDTCVKRTSFNIQTGQYNFCFMPFELTENNVTAKQWCGE